MREIVKKFVKYQLFRRLSQLVFFCLFAGMYALAFNNLRRIFTILISGKIDYNNLLAYSTPIFVVIILNLLVGRFFCGWFCAFGAFNDFIYMFRKRDFFFEIAIPPNVDKYLRKLKYLILLFIVVFVWIANFKFLDKLDPWDAFAQLGALSSAIFYYPWAFAVLVLVIIAGMLIERFFCRYLCPLGAFQVLMPKYILSKIKKNSMECCKCRICSVACPMGLPLNTLEEVNTPECIKCLNCVDACPKKNQQIYVANKRINGIVYVVAAMIVFALVYIPKFDFIQTTSSSVPVNSEMASLKESSESNEFGISQEAFKAIKEIILLSNTDIGQAETPQRDTAVLSTEGTTGLDSKPLPTENPVAVSPITATSIPTTKPTLAPTLAPTIAPTAAPTVVQKATPTITSAPKATPTTAPKVTTYKDGIFTGSANGHTPNMTVAVTIKNDKIVSIDIIYTKDNKKVGAEAFDSIPKRIINAQSTNVDVVSGATQTSKGIMNAVANALEKAKR